MLDYTEMLEEFMEDGTIENAIYNAKCQVIHAYINNVLGIEDFDEADAKFNELFEKTKGI